MAKIQSVEPNIADLANGWLKSYKLDYKLEQESLNTEIDQALNDYYAIRWIFDDRELSSRQYLFMVMCINKVNQ